SVSAYFRSEQWRTQMNDSGHSIEHNHRPYRLALVAQAPDSRLNPVRERGEIDASIVRIGRHQQQPLLNPFHRRTPLTHLRVVNSYAELEEDAEEVGLVADAFEEELLEAIACFEVLAFIEECDAADESWVPYQFNDQFQVSDRS
ncbi:MAG TPA: hypothetical protein VGA84_01230, partial [Thermoanaerobaculia bacterium]